MINGVTEFDFMQKIVKIGRPKGEPMKCKYCPFTRSRHASRLRIICTETNEDVTDIYDTGVGLECTLEECEG